MSSHPLEGNLFVSSGTTQLVGGSTDAAFAFFRPLTDTYWDLRIVPRGTNTNLEIIRQFVRSDPFGTRTLVYVVRNNTSNPTAFTRGAVTMIPTFVVGPGLVGQQAFSQNFEGGTGDEEGAMRESGLSISRLHVAYEQDGTIEAITFPGGDRPVPGPEVSVSEMHLPLEFRDMEPVDLFRVLRVEPSEQKLIRAD